MQHTYNLQFELSRMQRIVNPVSRLMFTLCMAVIAAVSFSAVHSILGFILGSSIAFLMLIVCRKFVISIWRSAVSRHYIDTLYVTQNRIGFGAEGIQYEMQNTASIVVSKGILDTLVGPASSVSKSQIAKIVFELREIGAYNEKN